MSCQARQVNEQMHCAACGLQWDVSDPEPPECLRKVNAALSPTQLPIFDPASFEAADTGAHFLPQSANWLPADLSDELAARMARAYRSASDGHAGVFGVGQHEIRAMRAAYRVLLDQVTP